MIFGDFNLRFINKKENLSNYLIFQKNNKLLLNKIVKKGKLSVNNINDPYIADLYNI